MFWKRNKNESGTDAHSRQEKKQLDEELAQVHARIDAILRKKNAIQGNSSSEYSPTQKVVKTDTLTHWDAPEQRTARSPESSIGEAIHPVGAKNKLRAFWNSLRHALQWKKDNTAFSPPLTIVNLWRKMKGKQLTRREKAKLRYHFYFVLFVVAVVIWGFCLMAFK